MGFEYEIAKYRMLKSRVLNSPDGPSFADIWQITADDAAERRELVAIRHLSTFPVFLVQAVLRCPFWLLHQRARARGQELDS